MEELAKKVEQILNQYAAEEIGNKVSQFSLLALKEIILNQIKSYKPKEGKKDDKALSK